MYNDAWGENGWSIIDYYLRRKPSYYNVKRGLSPRRLLIRRGGQVFGGREDEVLLLAINECPEPLTGSCRFGYVSYDGQRRKLKKTRFHLAGRSQAIIARCQTPCEADLAVGTIVAVPEEGLGLAPASWLHCRFREANIPPADVRVVSTRRRGQDLLVTVASDTFAHAVHLNVDGDWRLSDHYFDLLPGEARTIVIFGAAAGLDPNGLQAASVTVKPSSPERRATKSIPPS